MAVKAISSAIDVLLVVGSQNSSNSKRLVEVGANFSVRSYLVNDSGDVDSAWLDGVKNVGVTAGASAPEHLVQDLMDFLRDRGFSQLEEIELVGQPHQLMEADLSWYAPTAETRPSLTEAVDEGRDAA